MADPLSPFRKTAAASPGAPAGGGRASDEYAAFGAKDRVSRLRIRSVMAPTHSPGYLYLRDVAYNGEFGTNFALDFTFMMVLVRGRNLQPVVSALESGMADFIQEFDAKKWAKPTDPATPVIDSIEIIQEAAPPSGAGQQTRDSVNH